MRTLGDMRTFEPLPLAVLALGLGSGAASHARPAGSAVALARPRALQEETAGQAAGGWTALELPRLALDTPARRDLGLPLDGRHLRFEESAHRTWSPPEPGRAFVPPATLRRAVADAIAREDLDLELHPSGAIFALRGAAEDTAFLRERFAELERAGAALRVRLDVAWTPPGSALADAEGLWESIELASGEAGVLGQRSVQPFVAGYEVEVANESGVADPIVGEIVLGRTLRLVPGRTAGGRRVHVAGLLDAAELAELAVFDPATPELGLIQVPHVRTLQLAFADFVEPGEALRVDIAGSGVAGIDGTLWIRATTGLDPEPGPDERAWRVLDVAWLERKSESLPAPRPGAGLDASAPQAGGRALATPLAAIELLNSAVQAASGRPALEMAPGLLFGPAADAAAWRAIDVLVSAAEAQRSGRARLEVRAGALAVSLPATQGFPLRVLSGSERTWLVDYAVTLAPQTWMPVPDVQAAFDGFSLEGELASGRVELQGFAAATGAALELTRDETTLGRLELPRRSLRTGSWSLGVGQAALPLFAGEGDAGSSVAVLAR